VRKELHMKTVLILIVAALVAAFQPEAFAKGELRGQDVRDVGGVDLNWDTFLDALQAVESGGESNPDQAVGDGGKALGAFQIWRVYWLDAVERRPDLKARGYSAVTDRAYAREVVKSYLTRYAPKGATWEDLARIHNGGPKGHLKKSTEAYWAKVLKAAKARSKQ
jgi:hypothetical protein